MKRNLLILSLLTCTASVNYFSQSNQKSAQQGAVIPAISHQITPSKGAVIFQEDFATGIPGDWNNYTVSGPVNWKYTTVGHTGDYPTQSLASTTSSNGWIIVDSDADNFSGGGAEDSRLTTPFIDCSGYSNVKVEFQQMFRRWQADVTTVRVSVDSGYTWVDYVINQSVTQSGTDDPDYVNIDISADIASNPDSVLIQLWWQGNWDYGWQIDDFAVKEIDPNDLLIKRTSLSQDVTYYQVPESQVQPLYFSAYGENIGYNAQTNVQLNVDINDGSSSVFNNSSSVVSSLTPGVSDSLYLTSTYTPAGIGSYDVTMDVVQMETDDVLANNQAILSMAVTDTVYAIDNGIYGGQWWNLDDGNGNSNPFMIGAVYEIVADEWASSASIFIGDNTTPEVVFELNIYVYNDATQDYDFIQTTDSYIVSNSDLGNWVSLRFLTDVELIAENDYLVAAVHYGGPEALYVGYGTNSSFSGSTLSNDNDGTTGWSGQPRTPMIRMNLGEVGLGVKEIENGVSFYPNPTSGYVKLNLKNSKLVNVKAYDISGKQILNSNRTELDFSSFSKGVYTLKVTTSEGVYTQKIQKD